MFDQRNSRSIQFTRRNALLTSLAVVALSGRWLTIPARATAPSIPADIPRAFIDAHCHVFNAHDIPMKRFIIETAVRESPDLRPWVGVASLLAWLIRLWVGLTDDEISLIDFPQAKPVETTEALDQTRFHLLVGDSVRRVAGDAAGGSVEFRSAETDPFSQNILKYGLKRAPDMFEVQTRSAPLALNLSAVSMNFLLGHYGLDGLKHADTGMRLQELRSEDLMGRVSLRAADDDMRSLTDSIVRDATTQSTDVGSIMSLARIISRARLRNIEVLDESLGVAAAKPGITRLYVPALVDFDCWYGDASSSLSIWKQTSIMSKLAKRQKDPNRFANGYVPLDPLRSVLMDNLVVEDLSSPLDTVVNAIQTQGFIGAKLYPPMGFRPYFNAELHNDDFGENIQPWISQLKTKTGDANFQLGPALDAQLMKLYSFCLSNDVPIMAHCSNSQTSFTGSGERAAPAYWLRLLELSDPATGLSMSNLRVNLGHFGSVWCQELADGVDPNPDSETERCHIARGWSDTIINAISPSGSTPARFPNVYFDLGDVGTITQKSDGGAWLRKLLDERSKEQQEAILSHMLYGTDWMFLVLFGKTHVEFIDSVHGLIADRPGAVTRIFHENAARFLGLTRDGRTAQRMREFYADDPDRLARFESLLV